MQRYLAVGGYAQMTIPEGTTGVGRPVLALNF
jgi:hypothetical protein